MQGFIISIMFNDVWFFLAVRMITGPNSSVCSLTFIEARVFLSTMGSVISPPTARVSAANFRLRCYPCIRSGTIITLEQQPVPRLEW